MNLCESNWMNYKRERETFGKKEIKKMMKLCVSCWLAIVFCLGWSLELGIESNPYSLELKYNQIYIE